MVNPQKENGFTGLANEIWEALAMIRISGECRQILDVVIRQTYGYQKKEDMISLSQFMDKTGLSKVAVCKAIVKLIEMNLIIVRKDPLHKSMSVYTFNKVYTSWKPLPKKVTNVTNNGNNRYQKSKQSLPILVPTIEINKKEKRKGEKSTRKARTQPDFTEIKRKLNDFANQNWEPYQAQINHYAMEWRKQPFEVKKELNKFGNYWLESYTATDGTVVTKCESVKGGFFEIKRRLATWLGTAWGLKPKTEQVARQIENDRSNYQALDIKSILERKS